MMLDLTKYLLDLPMSQVLGVGGFLFYIGSFSALQLRLIDGNGVLYCLLNIAAATLVLISLLEAFNLASVLINSSWILIGLIGLGVRYKRHKLAVARGVHPMAVQV